MTAQELDRLMVARFGPGYRDLAIVGPTSTFPLAGVFDECGLRDPKAPPPAPASRSVGLWQTTPGRAR